MTVLLMHGVAGRALLVLLHLDRLGTGGRGEGG